MNISSAFLVAQSGLRSSELRASLVAGNIANAQAPGYARREGVQISVAAAERGQVVELQVMRQVDDSIAALTRGALSKVAGEQVKSDVLQGYLVSLGDPGDAISPAAHLAKFQTTLDLLSNNPSDADVQLDLLGQADSLVRSINGAGTSLEQARIAAESELDRGVVEANKILGNVARLNRQVNGESSSGTGHADLMDQIGRELDSLSEMMDVSVRWTATGQVELHTSGGTQLVYGDEVYTLKRNPVDNSLTAGDVDITPQKSGTRGFTGGKLGGLSEIVAEHIPRMQLQLDEFARALVTTFETADTSLANAPAGTPGLFTDAGDALDATKIEGLALRLGVNQAVRPQAGGDLWRLRDGMAATAEGPRSSSTQLDLFITALDTPQTFSGETGMVTTQRLDVYAAAMVGDQQNVRVTAENRAVDAAVEFRAFEDARGSIEGVNVDTEMQKLLEIEQSYAANAKVLTSLTEMIDTLLAAV